MATARRDSHDRFQRAEKRAGGKRGSYAQSVSRAAAIRDNEVLRGVVLDVLLCMLLPPYGVYRVCTQERTEPAVRIIGVVLSAIIMYLWFTVLIPSEKPQPLAIDRVSVQAAQVNYTSD